MVIGTLISNMMIGPFQDGGLHDSPSNYDLPFDKVTFPTSDNVSLSGWLIPAETPDKVIIQSHFGVQCNRTGWSRSGKGILAPWSSDIKFLRQIKYLHDKGYTVLAFDFRGHGESALGEDVPYVTWGPHEARDVVAAVKFISTHPKYSAASIGLLSICMGAGATTYAYGLEEGGLSEFPNVKALVAVQPLLYQYFVDAIGIPSFCQRMAGKVSDERLGFNLAQTSFLPYVEKISVPTLVLQNENDPWTSLDLVNDFVERLVVEKELMLVKIEKSRFAAYDYIGKSPENVMAWFDKHM